MHFFAFFADRAGLELDCELVDAVHAVHAIAYGRPRERTIAGVLDEWRGTCSTKHTLLRELLLSRWSETAPAVVHRPYLCTPQAAETMFGRAVAAAVPPNGLWDVHRYLTIVWSGRRIAIDVTFPAMPRWDGDGSMLLACGPGRDYAAGRDADADKRALESEHCDPAVREPFIAALS